MSRENLESIVAELVEQSRGRYYGKYRGFVVDNQDPEQRGRLRVTVPSVMAETVSGWAMPCLPYGGAADQGSFLIPDVDAAVWVEFEEGNLDAPIWVGTFWQQSGDPPGEAASSEPTTRILKTASGHRLQFDDADGEETILLVHSSDAQIEIDPDGTITLTDAQGSALTLDANATKATLEDANRNTLTMSSSGVTIEDAAGNKVEMAASGITVKGQIVTIEGTQVMLGGSGGEPVIKGLSFLTLFATHIHPTGVGPSGPPIPQGEFTALSQKVMTS